MTGSGRRRAAVACLFVAPALSAAAACTQRPRMCSAPTECGPAAGCVAGRCLPDGGTPAIQNARRLVIEPTDIAFVRRGDGASGGALPPTFTLGRDADGDAVLFLRFSIALTKDANVVEAYVLLDRSEALDADPVPLTLHAARIVEAWDGRVVSWALQPRLEESRSPSTTVVPTGRGLVRVDVRDLVTHWRLHDKHDQGIALIADTTSATGAAFALTVAEEAGPSVVESSPAAPLWGGSGARSGVEQRLAVGAARVRNGPRLELYVK